MFPSLSFMAVGGSWAFRASLLLSFHSFPVLNLLSYNEKGLKKKHLTQSQNIKEHWDAFLAHLILDIVLKLIKTYVSFKTRYINKMGKILGIFMFYCFDFSFRFKAVDTVHFLSLTYILILLMF